MPTPLRETILSAFATRLSAVRIPVRADMSAAQVIVMDDQGEEVSALDYETWQAEITVRVEALDSTDTGETRPTADNRLLAHLIDTATGTDRTMTSKCDDILYSDGGPLIADDPTVYAGAFATFLIRYRFDAGDPYTLTHY